MEIGFTPFLSTIRTRSDHLVIIRVKYSGVLSEFCSCCESIILIFFLLCHTTCPFSLLRVCKWAIQFTVNGIMSKLRKFSPVLMSKHTLKVREQSSSADFAFRRIRLILHAELTRQKFSSATLCVYSVTILRRLT
jgi:hypothetical protein